jgi:hypothetical protein
MQNKTTILAVSGATIVACLCLCLLAFFVLASCSIDEPVPAPQADITATEPAQREYPEYPLPGPDEPPASNIPSGGLGNDKLRADVWMGILSVTECPGVSASDVSIQIDEDDPSILAEYWLLYCPSDVVEIYYLMYEEVPGGVDYLLTRLPTGHEDY